MPLCTRIFGGLVLLALTGAGMTQSIGPRAVTEDDVVEGMKEKGIVVQRGQVSMLSTIPTTVPHPGLELTRVEPLSSNTSRILMRCSDRTACIPFYVVVTGTLGQAAANDKKKTEISTEVASAALGAFVRKKGRTVTLEIIAPEMTITVPVVCLQNGRMGDRIRAASLDRKNIYQAEVVSTQLLRSSL